MVARPAVDKDDRRGVLPAVILVIDMDIAGIGIAGSERQDRQQKEQDN